MEWIELGKLIEFQKKSKIKAGDGKTEGKYLMYTSSMLVDKYLDEYQYSEEALIMGTGGNASIHYSSGKFGTSTDCYVIYNKGAKALLKYIYYYLLGNIYILEEGFRGAGLKHTNQKYIKNIKIPILSVEIQEKIVRVLDQAQALIDKRKEQIKALDQLIESIFYTMFGDPVRNEKGWEVKELEEVLLNNVSNIKKDFKDDISYIDIGSINNNNNSIETYNNFKIKNAPSRAKRILNHGDILFSTVRPNLKNIAIFDMYTENTAIGSTGFCIIRVNESLVNNKYIFNVVKNKRLTGYLVKIAEGASYPAVKDSDIKSIKISIPPLSLQNEFAQKVQIIEKQKELLEESLELLDENYKSIMDRAFKGQLFN